MPRASLGLMLIALLSGCAPSPGIREPDKKPDLPPLVAHAPEPEPLVAPDPIQADGIKLNETANSHYPLQSGNRWVYDAYQDDSKIKQVVELQVDDNEYEIDRSLVALLCRLNSSPAGLERLKWTEDGLHRHRAKITFDPPLLLLKTPIKPKDAWTGSLANIGIYSCESREEAIEVPAGKFKTVRVEITITAGERVISKETNWYARGVGEVKSTFEGHGSKVLRELRRFERKKTTAKLPKE